MYQVSYYVDSPQEVQDAVFELRVEHPDIGRYPLLILLFSHWNQKSKDAFDEARRILGHEFPKAAIAGMSTSGSIMDGHLFIGKTVVSFLSFEKSEAAVQVYDLTRQAADTAAEELLDQLLKKKRLAAVCLMGTTQTVDMTAFCHALSHLPKDVPVFGGGAMGHDLGDPGMVMTRDGLFEKAIVAISFTGPLRARLNTVLGWHPLGLPMTITATDGNKVIKELDGRPAVEVYEKYLKMKRSPVFGGAVLSFPLLLNRNGKLLARLPSGSREDGALLMTANCYVGETVRLSYGDPGEIIASCNDAGRAMRAFEPEAMLFFNCITRRLYLKENSDKLLFHYGMIANMAGGYTHGEINRVDGTVNNLNMTQVDACLSEKPLTPRPQEPAEADKTFTFTESLSTLQRLATFVSTTSRELEETYKKLAYTARHDGLTGLLNRGAIEEAMKKELATANAKGRPLSAIMMDLDDFKSINDTCGHEMGDRVLKAFARTILDSIRIKNDGPDYAGRWGGDEFVVLLPGTPLPIAKEIAERIQEKFVSHADLPETLHATASFGCTTSTPGESQEDFYKSMDHALYKAKRAGKNQVVVVRS